MDRLSEIMIAQYEGISLISKGIRWWTRGTTSHTALCLPTGETIEAWHKGGVRAMLHPLLDHTIGTPVRYYQIQGVSEEQEAKMVEFCRAQVGKKYDFAGIMGFIRHRDRHNLNKWFCSELVLAASIVAGYPLLHRVEPYKVSPTELGRSPLLVPSIPPWAV